MDFPERIKKIVSEIIFDKIADIGTDHGYIPILVATTMKFEKIIACDLNKEPLENCKNNLITYKLSDKIETRLGSGISKIEKNEVDTVIIAGMGGNTIIDILNQEIGLALTIKQFILQPQSSVMKVRKFIHNMNFQIINEETIFEDGLYYNIINCVNKKENDYSYIEYYLGKICMQKKSPQFISFLNYENKKLKTLKEKIIKNTKNIDLCKEKLNSIEYEIDIIENFLNSL